MRRGQVWLWLTAALAVRLAFALKLGGRLYQTDELSFVEAARALAAAGRIPGVMPPVPVAFFALFFKLGQSLVWPRLGQAFVGAVTAWLIGAATEDLTGSERAGLWALAISCVYPFFIYYGGMTLSETWYVALTAAGLWQLCRALRDSSARSAAVAGLCLGLAALCRAEAAFILAPIWAVAAIGCAARRWSWRAWAAGVLIWAIPLFAWCARNRAAVGAFTLDIHGGMALLHGNEFFAQNEIDTGEAYKAIEASDFYKQSLSLPDAQRDAAYKREAFAWMAAHPAETAIQWTTKLVNFWRFYPRTDKAYAENERSAPNVGLGRGLLVVVSLLFEPALILGGFYGLWLLRRSLPFLWPLWLWILGTCALHVISVSQMRYRLPVMPALMIGFAYAAAAILKDSQSLKR